MRWFFCFIDFTSTVIILMLFYSLIEDKSTSMVVLADNGRIQNAVSIKVGKYKAKLDKVGATVSLRKGEKPSEVRMMSDEEMNRRFGDVLKAEPPKAKKIILYLNESNTALSSQSKEKMMLVIKTIKKRMPCVVNIIGHTDTTGDATKNIKVSLKRAKIVQELIVKEGINISILTIKGYGEEKLLVQTPDNTKEPINRNVEVFIK